MHRDAAHLLAVQDNVLVVLSKEAPTLRFMKVIVSEMFTLSSQCRAPIGALWVVPSNGKVPDEDTRAYIRDCLRPAPLAAAAHVVLGNAFMGNAMRSALSMLQLLGNFPFSLRTFDALYEATDWMNEELAKRVSGAPDPLLLANTTSKLQREFFAQR
jgi:hypothetical protein